MTFDFKDNLPEHLRTWLESPYWCENFPNDVEDRILWLVEECYRIENSWEGEPAEYQPKMLKGMSPEGWKYFLEIAGLTDKKKIKNQKLRVIEGGKKG